MTKRCRRCGIDKDIECFTNRSISPDGKHLYCRDCSKIQNNEQYYKDVDKSREQARESARRNEPKVKIRRKKHYDENREAIRGKAKKVRALKAPEENARRRVLYAENPEKFRAYQNSRPKEPIRARQAILYRKNSGSILLKQSKKYFENPEPHKERERIRYALDPTPKRTQAKKWALENPELIKERNKKYQEDNSEYLTEYHRQYRILNFQAVAKLLRDWRRRNPEKCLGYVHKRRAIISLGGKISINTIKRYFLVENCEYCSDALIDTSGSKQRTLEHIIPISRGGTNHDSNLVAVCRTCNFSKHDKVLLYEWLPPALESLRERTYTAAETAAYLTEEVARQRAELAAEAALNPAQELAPTFNRTYFKPMFKSKAA